MATIQPQMVHGQYNQPVILNTQPQPSPQIARYASTFNKLGTSQIVLGVISMVIGILLIILAVTAENYYYRFIEYVAPGIWGGAFFLTSGILGRASASKQNTCSVTGGMVMAIFSALAAVSLFILEIFGAIDSTYSYYPHYESYGYITVFHCLLCILGFVELIIAIVHSAYCCAASSCCCADTPNTQQIIMTTGSTNPMMHNTALPVQVNTVGYVTQPQFGATVQLPTGSYYGVNNHPVGVIPNNNRMTTGNSSMDLPPQYQQLKSTSQIQ